MEDYKFKHYRERSKTSRILTGVILLVIGALLVAKQSGVYLPSWLLTWQMLLITIGIVVGIKHRFRGVGWLVPMLIGCFFLFDRFFPGTEIRRYFLPAGVIIVGLAFIFRGNRRCLWHPGRGSRRGNYNTIAESAVESSNDVIDENVVFGNVKKNVISKHFAGGEINTVFGSAEINLTKAEIVDTARMEINAVFGSVRIIVPPHWQIKLENNSVLGGVEDKRPETLTPTDKILLLEANAVLGGIEIRSY